VSLFSLSLKKYYRAEEYMGLVDIRKKLAKNPSEK